jgi:hypothetical protein
MHPDHVIIKFEQVAEQTQGAVTRLIGFVKARNMLGLFDAADLKANPRSAKAGPVTEDIIESIEDDPSTFPFKTKGILLGASRFQRLERSRYHLQFVEPDIEGVLDGGHNMLAVGTQILSRVIVEGKELNKIRMWPDLKSAWTENREEVALIKDQLDFLVPIEILVPSNLGSEEIVDAFRTSLLGICAARNNNVELTLETKAHKKGFYEELQKSLPASIARKVEWKTNDGGSIKVRDVIALTWIPLSVIELPEDLAIAPQNIYRNKGECAKLFDRLMHNEQVSKKTGGQYTHELHSTSVYSALVIAGKLPELYDRIYRDFPDAYNRSGGSFGKIGVVKRAKDMKSKPTAHFGGEEVRYSYPDGLIMPLVYGLKALMFKDSKNQVQWKEDPVRFLTEHLDPIVRKYRVILEAFRYDPQKVGKNEGSYNLVLDAFETELLRRKAA